MQEATGSSPQARGTSLTLPYSLEPVRFIPTSAGNIKTGKREGLTDAVHPHKRGEHDFTIDSTGAISGSSPQARGTSTHCKLKSTRLRFIPTSAGNMGQSASSTLTTAVHPHKRGEHSGADRGSNLDGGSSPQARGTYFDFL